ncbi:DUF4129 domain-containing protein [Arthrobacter sp. I2-34]|uniref:DUF4129 domain-containing protein n=1 Tax=Arthrobacter hankyongi TaxID=2904801 RepID=A0ABS9L8C8_9MICC|nr:DUF4129 domain-containing protein [Arthrobacter hankyongi]MCG2622739.1 DUF4129 domain-containing protein [Arthrobacter hankyongi]
MGPLIAILAMGAVPGAAPRFDAPVTPGPDEARELLIRELARQPYQDAKPGLLQDLLNRFLQWLEDLLTSLKGLDPNAGTLLIGLTVLLLIAAMIWIVKPRLDRRRRREAEVFDAAIVRTAAEHRGLAAAAAARGEWNTAVTEQFRALVRACEERTVLEAQPGRTADEAAGQLGPVFPGHADSLRRAAARFDAVRYGNVPADRDGYQRIRELDTALAAAAPVFPGQPLPDPAVPR